MAANRMVRCAKWYSEKQHEEEGNQKRRQFFEHPRDHVLEGFEPHERYADTFGINGHYEDNEEGVPT